MMGTRPKAELNREFRGKRWNERRYSAHRARGIFTFSWARNLERQSRNGRAAAEAATPRALEFLRARVRAHSSPRVRGRILLGRIFPHAFSDSFADQMENGLQAVPLSDVNNNLMTRVDRRHFALHFPRNHHPANVELARMVG